MIRTYVYNAIRDLSNLIRDDSTKGKINSHIIETIANWKEPNFIVQPTSIKELIRQEVDAYMLNKPVQFERVEKIATTTTKTERSRYSGTVLVTSSSPPMGRIEDGSTISFTSQYPIAYGEQYPYTYDKTSGIYTVYTASKGKILPYPGKWGGGSTLSEQSGFIMMDQTPDINRVASINIKETKAAMAHTIDTLFCRLSQNLAAYIKDNKYYEFKTTDSLSTPVKIVITKTIDLAKYLTLNTGETLTIGKYIYYQDCVFVLVCKHTRYASKHQYASQKLGERYNYRAGGASIRGELLIINRSTNIVTHLAIPAVSPFMQVYWSGYVDMLIDAQTDELIFATLSTTPYTMTLTYDTAKVTILGSDRHAGSTVTYTTASTLNAFISSEVHSYGIPHAMHIIQEGVKTWELKFPTLSVKRFKFTKNDMTLAETKELYTEISCPINLKQNTTCVGGYVNCMLYQDVHSQDMPIYIGRTYDAWTQYPYPSSDYIVVPQFNEATYTYSADITTYVNSALPGELIGFFGIDYFKLNKDKSLTFLADIPGGHGISRTFLKDDLPGSAGISGIETNSYLTLLELNNYVSTSFIEAIRTNSIYHTFSGGPGSSGLALDSINQGSWYYSYLWGVGIHIYNTRFVILTDSGNKLKKLVLLGSYEPMQSTKDGLSYRGHFLDYTKPQEGSSGAYLVDLIPVLSGTNTYWKVNPGALNWETFDYTSHVKSNPNNLSMNYYVNPQFTIQATRGDIQLLDASSYYILLCNMRRQYDRYMITTTLYVEGFIWWQTDRQMYTVKNNALSGWAAEVVVNFRGTEILGSQTPKLQLY